VRQSPPQLGLFTTNTSYVSVSNQVASLWGSCDEKLMASKERRILVVEDDSTARAACCELINLWGYKAKAAEDGEKALELVKTYAPHILLLDLKMPGKDGLAVLAELREQEADVVTIVISGEGEIPDAVKAIKLGAYDYLQKPIDPNHLRNLIDNLSEHLTVREENAQLRRRLAEAGELGSLVGRSRAMRRVLALVEQVAPSSASVVITGESGVGKEVVARTIHELSLRSKGPYIAVNCAAIAESLMESELFGHERGAFTGADRRRIGCFEMAHGGTLFLDEITEMKVELQAKLLRVLEEHSLRRVGGSEQVPVDVRVLASSNRSLEQAVRDGKLREDLYYRLNVFKIDIPPLRARSEDLMALADYFLRQFAERNGKKLLGFDHECVEALKASAWPGNVRQLRNVIERAAVVSRGPLVTSADLPPEIRQGRTADTVLQVRVGTSLEEVERELVYKTLEFAEGNKARAADILGVSLKTLYNKLERYENNKGAARQL
jgi:DNA-binding NtrC family response regulator